MEKAMAPHSSTLAWKIPWAEEPGRLQSMGSLRVGHDWATSLLLFLFHALEKEMATHPSVLAWRIPGAGEPGGLMSMGSHRVGHDWSDLAAVAASTYWSIIIYSFVCEFRKGLLDNESTFPPHFLPVYTHAKVSFYCTGLAQDWMRSTCQMSVPEK